MRHLLKEVTAHLFIEFYFRRNDNGLISEQINDTKRNTEMLV